MSCTVGGGGEMFFTGICVLNCDASLLVQEGQAERFPADVAGAGRGAGAVPATRPRSQERLHV